MSRHKDCVMFVLFTVKGRFPIIVFTYGRSILGTMKTRLIISLFFLSAFCMASASAFGRGEFGSGTRGNGNVTESERTVSAFTEIESNGSADIRLHRSPVVRVVVVTDSNLQDMFDARTENDTLKLEFKRGSGNVRPTKLVIDVWCPAIAAIGLSGSGNVEALDAFSVRDLTLSCSGSGSFEGTFEATELTVLSSGSGRFELEGSADSLDVSISGSGDFKSPRFSAKSARIKSAGSGSAELSVSEYLKVTLSGSGSVRYSGRPKTDVSISGSGRMTSVD